MSMKKPTISFAENAGDTASRLERLLKDLPETISLEDLKHHKWLHRLALACDDLSNRVEYRAIDWAKTQGYPE